MGTDWRSRGRNQDGWHGLHGDRSTSRRGLQDGRRFVGGNRRGQNTLSRLRRAFDGDWAYTSTRPTAPGPRAGLCAAARPERRRLLTPAGSVRHPRPSGTWRGINALAPTVSPLTPRGVHATRSCRDASCRSCSRSAPRRCPPAITIVCWRCSVQALARREGRLQLPCGRARRALLGTEAWRPSAQHRGCSVGSANLREIGVRREDGGEDGILVVERQPVNVSPR